MNLIVHKHVKNVMFLAIIALMVHLVVVIYVMTAIIRSIIQANVQKHVQLGFFTNSLNF